LEEKAGLMFIQMTIMKEDGSLFEIPSPSNPFSFMLETTSKMMLEKKMNHFNILAVAQAEEGLMWHNDVQKMAERTRLGIPITLATDPRHGKGSAIGTAVGTRFFTRWPSQLGFGAIGDTAIVKEFGDIARQEYLALGLRLALHPMADLGTEPRWTRVNGTFGEDAELAAKLTKAYILGFQGDSLGTSSVACMTKHFSGGGPQEDGWDAHFASGKGQAYPGNNFDYHLIPFIKGAFPAGTSQIMPYYGIPNDQTSENVGFAFNKEIITDLLRDSLKFYGIICTDWALVTDLRIKKASAWGVEHLSEKERVEKILTAGNDMMGGESRPELVVQLVNDGKISESRIDVSARRILREKFILGLFDNPYLDESNLSIFNNETNREKGKSAQRKSMVLLKNENNILPLSEETKLYVEGMDQDLSIDFGTLVSSPDKADFVVLKLKTPTSLSPDGGAGFMESMFPQGRLDFPEGEKKELLELINSKPTITIMSLGRPPVIPDINEASKAVIADFENDDEIILELIYGRYKPTGKLPIEIPSSVEAVENQFEDLPYDSKNPLYSFGFGLSYR
ncbi:MAG: glycoside hydrolase family 3 N-terminal domain-containing protein, partial [Saprospiraceae bacterium]|nr:glycoside hydrolase family 3 N-terminal domain-containing protein [Saprospiraceae bacterium]